MNSRTLDFAICLFRQSLYRAKCTIHCQHIRSNFQFRQIPDDLHGFQRYSNDTLYQFQWIFQIIHRLDCSHSRSVTQFEITFQQ